MTHLDFAACPLFLFARVNSGSRARTLKKKRRLRSGRALDFNEKLLKCLSVSVLLPDVDCRRSRSIPVPPVAAVFSARRSLGM